MVGLAQHCKEVGASEAAGVAAIGKLVELSFFSVDPGDEVDIRTV
jgi:hypothetical protein